MIKYRIEVVNVPVESNVASGFGAIHYTDAYRIEVPGRPFVLAHEAAIVLFGTTPGWMRWLLKLRDAIVRPFGIRTASDREDKPQLMFALVSENSNETVLGEKDRHLDFRVSLYIDQVEGKQRLTVTTIVHFNNWLGRAYFLPVRPFHRIIVKSSLKRFTRHE
jgi:hypothetical protein